MPTTVSRSVFIVMSLGMLVQPSPGRLLSARPGDADRVQPNDNRRPGGVLRGGLLSMHLEARLAGWHPNGEGAAGVEMPAFAEEGGVAQIPGPLIRVLSGTEVEVSVRNALADTLVVHGLYARTRETAKAAPPLALAPGERRALRFRLDAPGTYHYWGTTTRRIIDFRTGVDAQLSGAIVVDDPAAGAADDRIFVVGMWTDTVARARTHRQRVLAVINGRSWPATERITQAVGDTVRWRLINASADLHPMHLHGFFFRVTSRGDGVRDTVYADGAGGLAVTEKIGAGGTMTLEWIPERAGNWLFHCHIPEHFEPRGSLGLAPSTIPAGATAHGDHAKGGMSGLVMGVTVRPGRDGTARTRTRAVVDERQMRLLVRPQRGSSSRSPQFSYAWHERGAEPPLDSGVTVGPALDLERGRPVRIAVVNRLPEPTAVHWHGIELESYYDGVPGFSGAGARITPLIAPGDSFVVRFTPPRAGTFMYHTHADETRQQFAGLAGALVVSESGRPRDPAIDIPLVLTEPAEVDGRGPTLFVNGSSTPAPLELAAGTTYRLRIIQISVTWAAVRMELLQDSALVTWRPVAKDGATIPEVERKDVPARVRLGIGETLDVEITPRVAGAMRLELRRGLPWPLPSPMLTTVPIEVR